MSQPKSISCPNCGASLPHLQDSPNFVCEFCSSEFPNPDFAVTAKEVPKAAKVVLVQPASNEPQNAAPSKKPTSLVTSCVFAFVFFGLFFGMIFGCCFFMSVISSVGHRSNRPVTDEHREIKTSEKAKALTELFSKTINEKGEIFDDEQGAIHMRSQSARKDEWGRDFRYEQYSDSAFVIRSPGKDGDFLTGDDIWKKEEVTKWETSIKPKDFSEPSLAIKTLNSAVGYKQHANCRDWIITNRPKLRPTIRDEVFKRACQVTFNRETEEENRLSKLTVALAGDSTATIEDYCIRLFEDDHDDAAKWIIDELAERDAKKSLESFYNFPVESIRNSVSNHFEQLKYETPKLVELCEADLNFPSRRNVALQRLAYLEIQESRKVPVGKSILKSLRGTYLTVSDRRMRSPLDAGTVTLLLKKFSDPELIPELCETFSNGKQFYKEFANVLAQSRDERAFACLFEACLVDGRKGTYSQKIIESDIGQAAETHVWNYLENSSRKHRVLACELLEHLGSTESISHLEPLLDDDDRGVQFAAERAIQKIETRSSNNED